MKSAATASATVEALNDTIEVLKELQNQLGSAISLFEKANDVLSKARDNAKSLGTVAFKTGIEDFNDLDSAVPEVREQAMDMNIGLRRMLTDTKDLIAVCQEELKGQE